jgi:hypothetical protein
MRDTAALIVAALMLTAIVLGAGLAHMFEMLNKFNLARDDYLIVQQIYRGWALVGIPLYLAMIVILLAAWRLRAAGALATWVLGAFGALLLGHVVFWIWTYPANAATAQWTMLPDGWQSLRRQWEVSHAVGALCSLAALFCLSVAAVRLPEA